MTVEFNQAIRDREEWTSDGACVDLLRRDEKTQAELDEIFFPSDVGGGQYEEARQICRICKVREECLVYGLHPETINFGMLGGATYEERRNILKANRGRINLKHVGRVIIALNEGKYRSDES
ncbi:WhiB family transcriptional regulator [Candidatus Microgenomates bacterium]|nr:WhiB family transcriptional regulator [Candidatus Microgenomates bacterium]